MNCSNTNACTNLLGSYLVMKLVQHQLKKALETWLALWCYTRTEQRKKQQGKMHHLKTTIF